MHRPHMDERKNRKVQNRKPDTKRKTPHAPCNNSSRKTRKTQEDKELEKGKVDEYRGKIKEIKTKNSRRAG